MPRHFDLEIFAAFDELALFVSREIDEDTCRNGNRAECHDDDFRIAAHVVADVVEELVDVDFFEPQTNAIDNKIDETESLDDVEDRFRRRRCRRLRQCARRVVTTSPVRSHLATSAAMRVQVARSQRRSAWPERLSRYGRAHPAYSESAIGRVRAERNSREMCR